MIEPDQERLDQLRPLLGDDRLLALAAELAAGLAGLPDLPPGERRERLHRLRGGAASLGFPALAAALLRAEAQPMDVRMLADAAAALVPALAARLHGGPTQR